MDTLKRDDFCSFCGTRHTMTAYPKQCGICHQVTYRNAVAVGVGLVPVNQGLLVIRRGIPPHVGELALPGGFKEVDETWEEGIAREVFEETGVRVDPAGITLAGVKTAHNGTVLVFGLCAPVVLPADPYPFVPDPETREVLVLDRFEELCFPHHTAMARWFWSR